MIRILISIKLNHIFHINCKGTFGSNCQTQWKGFGYRWWLSPQRARGRADRLMSPMFCWMRLVMLDLCWWALLCCVYAYICACVFVVQLHATFINTVCWEMVEPPVYCFSVLIMPFVYIQTLAMIKQRIIHTTLAHIATSNRKYVWYKCCKWHWQRGRDKEEWIHGVAALGWSSTGLLCSEVVCWRLYSCDLSHWQLCRNYKFSWRKSHQQGSTSAHGVHQWGQRR